MGLNQSGQLVFFIDCFQALPQLSGRLVAHAELASLQTLIQKGLLCFLVEVCLCNLNCGLVLHRLYHFSQGLLIEFKRLDPLLVNLLNHSLQTKQPRLNFHLRLDRNCIPLLYDPKNCPVFPVQLVNPVRRGLEHLAEP